MISPSGPASGLSGEEVSALIAELDDAALTSAVQTQDEGVRSFALGEEMLRPTARLAGLERMNERLARRLRTVIEPLARAKAKVEAGPLETSRFDEWRDGIADFTSLSLYRLRPLKGNMLIALEPAFIANMVDAFYGGTGSAPAPKKFEFTPSEDRFVSRLTEAIVEVLVELWSEVVPFQPSLAGRETNAAYATMGRPEETVVIQRFHVAPGNCRPTTISILYPLGTLRPIEAELSAKVHSAGDEDSEWRGRLAAALEHVRLPVRSVLARPEISVAQLMALKVGDVIPITLSPSVPLFVGTRRLAEGTIGEQEGRAALMIESVGVSKSK